MAKIYVDPQDQYSIRIEELDKFKINHHFLIFSSDMSYMVVFNMMYVFNNIGFFQNMILKFLAS